MSDQNNQPVGSACPSRDVLFEFTTGRLAMTAAEVIADHLATCGQCQETLDDLEKRADPLVDRLRDALDDVPVDGQECARVVSRVEAIFDGSTINQTDEEMTPRIRCPHCHDLLALAEDADSNEIVCGHCGGRFRLAADPPSNLVDGPARKVAHFELLDWLGEGSFGTVWKGRDTVLERIVAVKIPRRASRERSAIDPLLREAKAAARIQHPNVVRVHEVGRDGDLVYIVSDYVDGVNLAQSLQAGAMACRQAAELAIALAEGLQAAHAVGVVHRDLKPSNILIDREGKPHIADFGLAKHEATDVTITLEGRLLGTPAYMSPEQARGRPDKADQRSDIYSLGVILFELLTGRTPFQGDMRRLVAQVLFDDPPRPRKFAEHVSRDLETICLKCLEKAPGRRYQSADALVDDLRCYLAGKPIQARPISRVARFCRLCKRKPLVTGLSATLAVAVVIVVTSVQVAYFKTSASLKEAETNLYFSQISAAQMRWLANDPHLAEAALEACPTRMRGFEWGYLKGLQDSAVHEFPNSGSCVAYSPDGTKIATGGGNGYFLRIWDSRTHELLHVLEGHTSFLSDLDFSPDGQSIVSAGGADRSIRLWDAVEGYLVRVVGYHERSAGQCKFSADGKRIISCGGDSGVRVWDSADGVELSRIEPGPAMIREIAVCPVGSHVAISAGRLERVTVDTYDFDTGKKLQELPADASVMGLAYSPDGRRLATAEFNGMIRIWEFGLDSPRQVGVIPGPIGRTPSLTFSTDGQRIAAVVWDGAIRIWDVATSENVYVIRGHTSPKGDLAFGPEGRYLASGSGHDTVLVWDTKAEQGTITLAAGKSLPLELEFSPNAKLLAVSLVDGTIKVWDTDTLEPVLSLAESRAKVFDLAFDSSGHRLATANGDKAVRIYDLEHGQLLREFKEHSFRPFSVAFSPDGKLVASAGCSREVLLWEADTGKVIHSFPMRVRAVHSVAFHPSGAILAAGDDSAVVAAWALPSGKELWREVTTQGKVSDLAFSPDGQLLAVGRNDGNVYLRNPAEGTLLGKFGDQAYQQRVAVAFSPDSRRLVAATRSTAVSLWEIPTGRAILNLSRSSKIAECVAFSPDGRMIASGASDGTVKLWLSVPR